MASLSETLTSKKGGIPVWGWFALGLAVLVLIMIERKKKAAASTASSSSATTGSSDVGSAQAAAGLTTAAAPMAYMGGDIYTNVQTSPTQAAAAPTNQSTIATLTPGSTLNIQAAVQGGKTVTSIAQQFGDTLAQVLAANPGVTANSQNLNVNVPYTVQAGDTIDSVAQKFMITPAHLQADLNSQPNGSNGVGG